MLICGQAGRGPGKMANGMVQKAACINQQTVVLPGSILPAVYQQQHRVWAGLVFV